MPGRWRSRVAGEADKLGALLLSPPGSTQTDLGWRRRRGCRRRCQSWTRPSACRAPRRPNCWQRRVAWASARPRSSNVHGRFVDVRQLHHGIVGKPPMVANWPLGDTSPASCRQCWLHTRLGKMGNVLTFAHHPVDHRELWCSDTPRRLCWPLHRTGAGRHDQVVCARRSCGRSTVKVGRLHILDDIRSSCPASHWPSPARVVGGVPADC